MSKTKWRSGPPPSIGWWPTGPYKFPLPLLRWWNGRHWSYPVSQHERIEDVRYWAAKPADVTGIKWTDRPADWPARSRT